MDVRTYLTCLWPGLSELWWRGRLSALPLAIGFALGLNALLVLRFLIPSWLDPLLVRLAFWVGFAFWVYWTLKSIRELHALLHPREVCEHPDRFAEAQTAYLRCEWAAAEAILLEMLAVDPRDPPALLLLSGVYRHSGRWRHAQALLEETCRLEAAAEWEIEIQAERVRVQRAAELASEQDDEQHDERNDEQHESEAEDAAAVTADREQAAKGEQEGKGDASNPADNGVSAAAAAGGRASVSGSNDAADLTAA